MKQFFVFNDKNTLEIFSKPYLKFWYTRCNKIRSHFNQENIHTAKHI